MPKITAGVALCGSFCTFSSVIPQLENLVNNDIRVIPIMSENAYSTDTRFGKASYFVERIESICKAHIIHSINDAEPIGPQKLLDILIIIPCTGNTLAKLSTGIADTSVTLAAKSQLRNKRPVLIGISTNDGLAGASKNIGFLQNYKNIYFIPYLQDDYINKSTSIVADFTKTLAAMNQALEGKQIQPVLLKE